MATMAATFPNIPGVHRALTDTQAWNDEYEKLLSDQVMCDPEGMLLGAIMDARANKHQKDSDAMEYADLTLNTRYLQRNVTFELVQVYANRDFEGKWMAASVDERKKHALVGLSRGCGIARNLNTSRMYCSKELRLEHLSTNGQVVIDLLTAIAPENLTVVPATPQYVPDPRWDSLRNHADVSDDISKTALETMLVLRTKLITHVLHNIVHSFLGVPPPVIKVTKKARTREKHVDELADIKKQAQRALSDSPRAAKALKTELKDAYKARTALKSHSCTGCASRETPEHKFQKCGKCSKVDREMLYCSRDCQVKDWKRHKIVCGKPLDFETAAQFAAAAPSRDENPAKPIIGPPVGGFKRNLALLRQITCLQDYPDFDYCVYRSVYENNEDRGILKYDLPEFRLHRDKALTTGAPLSVGFICAYILGDISANNKTDFRREKVIEQFSKEYSIPTDTIEKLVKQITMMNFRVPSSH